MMKDPKLATNLILPLSATTVLLCAGCYLNPDSNRNADTTRITFSLTAPSKDTSPTRTEVRKVGDFSAVQMSGTGVVRITCGKPAGVSVVTNEKSLKDVITKADQGVLAIFIDSKANPERLVVNVSAPTLSRIVLAGTCNGILAGLKADSVSLTLSGASSLRAQGKVKSLSIRTFGSSRILAKELESTSSTVTTVGTSAAVVFSSGDLKAEASGASSVVVFGHPKTIRQASAEAGSIEID